MVWCACRISMSQGTPTQKPRLLRVNNRHDWQPRMKSTETNMTVGVINSTTLRNPKDRIVVRL
jgi:hypothetical protein